MITGATSGIGEAAAKDLARMGAKVIIVGRDATKCERVRNEVANAAGSSGDAKNVSVMVADLASLDSVRRLASDFLETKQPLHVLVNNAGLILGKRSVTKDGFETTFQVNYLSHFLLTYLLLNRIKESAPSRIINTSSDAHTGGHIDFNDLQREKHYSGLGAYSQSKLAQVLFTSELARRLAGTGVTVNAVHPGVVNTNWGRSSAGMLSVGLKIGGVFMISPEKGADTIVYLASSPEVANVTGKYFVKRSATASSKESMDDSEAKKLWDVSVQLLGLPPMG